MIKCFIVVKLSNGCKYRNIFFKTKTHKIYKRIKISKKGSYQQYFFFAFDNRM
jgi:hypothetical protein